MHGSSSFRAPDGSEYCGEFHNGCLQGQGERRWPCGRRYVGRWQKDMMWGEGKMVWSSGEAYCGQFRASVFHGRGEHIWPNGDHYAGEFTEGQQEGSGTFRDAEEGWVFTGQWLHGRMYGQGRMEWPDGSVYAGDWIDGVREGRGKLTGADGSVYEGPFTRNNVEGKGRKVFKDGAWFEGQFLGGDFEGHGVFRWPDGTEFEGLWHRGQIAGPGCHRHPTGTTITGTFKDGGASGEGTKSWACGCIYTGTLLRNHIDRFGTLRWPDGRCYLGRFEDGMLQGDGTLIWTDGGGICTYRGELRQNAFEGRGRLDWSSGASYEGAFVGGLYHGEGTFTWPAGRSVYHGSWVHGELCGEGSLECVATGSAGGSYAYVGSFKQGHMEGTGCVEFRDLAESQIDSYQGEFRASRFSGRGTFSWGTGAQLEGLFEDGYCNRVGRKVYPDGRVYTGELRYDLEHGKGVMSLPGAKCFVALWRNGEVVKELLDSCAPEYDLVETSHVFPRAGSITEGSGTSGAGAVGSGCGGGLAAVVPEGDALLEVDEDEVLDSFDGDSDHYNRTATATFADAGGTTVGGSEASDELCRGAQRKTLLPVIDELGQLVEGKALVVFLNGDRYFGHMRAGRKHGLGMYVYADMATYRGVWDEDVLNDVRHPVSEDVMPVEVRRLCAPGRGEAGGTGTGSLAEDTEAEAEDEVRGHRFMSVADSEVSVLSRV